MSRSPRPPRPPRAKAASARHGMKAAARRALPYHVARLGPIETEDGEGWFYLAVTGEERLAMINGDDDAAALRDALARFGDQPRTCDPALIRAGRALGFTAGETPDWAAPPIATMAFMLASGEMIALEAGPLAVEAVLMAFAQFLRAEPWTFLTDEIVVDLTVRVGGDPPIVYDAVVMGAGGIETGLALYQGPDARAALSAARASGDPERLRTFPMLSISVETEPTWAAERIGDVYGMAVVPLVMASGPQGRRGATARDLAILSAAIAAVLPLSPMVQATQIRFFGEAIGVPGVDVQAHIREPA